MQYSDTLNLEVPDTGYEVAFEAIFKAHFKALHAYAYTILRDDTIAEEIVQTMFLKIWERQQQLDVQGSIKAYLYRAVHNDSLNYLKHEKVKAAYQNHTAYVMKDETDNTASRVQLAELEERLGNALNELPEQCRTIFQLSRFEELKYKEIAERLGLSIKTVENQMGKALRVLRLKLVDFLPILIFLLFDN